MIFTARAKRAETPVTTGQQLASIIKACRNIMRKDKGLNGDLDRLPMLTWIMFLKFLDDMEKIRETEAQLKGKPFVPAIEPPYRWRDWAEKSDGITGDDLIAFVNQDEAMRPDNTKGKGLFKYLKSLQGENGGDRRDVIATVFRGTVNRMINGYLLRDVVNKINGIHFTSSEEIHTLSHLYESMLKEMRDAAGDSGEFYTPRPVVQFIVAVIDPKIGETILDPACGTGGFLVETFEHLKQQERTTKDHERIQKGSIFGGEAKSLPYLLSQMNLLLHGLEYPKIDPGNSLRFPLREIGDSERVDVIMTNPPFGGAEEKGILGNFPEDKQTAETTLLFLQLIMRKLKRSTAGKKGGRCGVVVPNGTLFSIGIGARIKEDLLRDFNLHTIVRLPKGVFDPYADIETNLLFFENGGPTKEIWYYQIPLPEGYHQYTKTKPIKTEEFTPVLDWIKNPTLTQQAWKIPIESIIANNFNLDVKNPNRIENEMIHEPKEIIKKILNTNDRAQSLIHDINNTIDLKLGRNPDAVMVKLKDLLTVSRNSAEIDPFKSYKQVTVRLYHKGVVLREEKEGQQIISNQWIVKKDQFIISRIDARNGAMGIVPSELDNAIVTNDFLRYDINQERVKVKYFDYITCTESFVHQCAQASEGTTNRKRLKPGLFLEITIPLLSLEDQGYVISKLEKVDEVKRLQEEVKNLMENLMPSLLTNIIGNKTINTEMN